LDQLLSKSTGTTAGGTSNNTSAGSNATGSASGDASASSTTASAPVIQINGSDPANIDIHSQYSDLGAVIVGPTSDLNLGIMASVDGSTSTPLSSIVIDTSTPGTHTISYSATDQNGLSGTAVRTVIVNDPSAQAASSSLSTVESATSTTP
jgi:hypothetical protein